MAVTRAQAYLSDSGIIAATPSLEGAPLAALAGDDGLIVTKLPGAGMVAARTLDGFTHVIELPEGVRGIELWDAPHWRDGGTFLEELDELEPAPVDLEPLADAPRGVAEALLDAVLAGEPVVVVDPDEQRRIAWLALASYALPRPVTFATYRADVEVSVAASGEGLDATLASTATASLYARVAAELARRGTLGPAVAQLDEPDAVALAVAGGATDLLAPTDLPRALELITGYAARGDVATAARAAAAVGAARGTQATPVPAADSPPATEQDEAVDKEPDTALERDAAAADEPAPVADATANPSPPREVGLEPDGAAEAPMSLADLEAMIARVEPVEPAAPPDTGMPLSELEALLTTDEVPMSLNELEAWLGGEPVALTDLEAALGAAQDEADTAVPEPVSPTELGGADDEAEAAVDEPVSVTDLEAALHAAQDAAETALAEPVQADEVAPAEPVAVAEPEPIEVDDAPVVLAEPDTPADLDARPAVSWSDADRAALDAWLALHVIARRLPAGDDSRVLAEAVLAHVLPFAAELGEDVPFVGVHAPTRPGAEVLAPWVDAVEDLAGTEAGAALLANGVELGLLGVDRGIDSRVADVLAEHFDSVQLAIEGIARQALLDPLTAGVTRRLADAVAEDPGKREQLRAYCRHQAAFTALGEIAPNHPSLSVMSTYLWALVEREPERRPSAARTLLMLDASAGADVRALWGEDGPATQEEHTELLSVYREAERRPPDADTERALQALMETPLTRADMGDPLALALRALPDHAEEPAYCAWYAAARQPGMRYGLGQWSRPAARALYSRGEDVPAERKAELLEIAAEQLIEPKTLDGYFDALERLREAAGPERFDRALTRALERRLEHAEDPTELLAVMFSIFSKAPARGEELQDRVLAIAARPFRRQDDDIRAHLGPRRQAEWDAWVGRHKRPRFARRRLFARRGR